MSGRLKIAYRSKTPAYQHFHRFWPQKPGELPGQGALSKFIVSAS